VLLRSVLAALALEPSRAAAAMLFVSRPRLEIKLVLCDDI
jgi:hypothetical protein